MIKRIFLDVDGVLADFIGAVGRDFNFDPDSLTTWDAWTKTGQTKAQFYDWLNSRGDRWWAALNAYPWTTALYEFCKSLAPTTIATAAAKSVGSVSGKKTWLNAQFGDDFDDYMIGGAKELLAKSDRVLIDDRDRNVERFRQAGGQAILFPRPWNANRKYSKAAYVYTVGQLAKLATGGPHLTGFIREMNFSVSEASSGLQEHPEIELTLVCTDFSDFSGLIGRDLVTVSLA